MFRPRADEEEETVASEEEEGDSSATSINLHQLLIATIEQKASDLHVTTGAPPFLRIGAETVPLKTAPLTPHDCKALVYSVMTPAQVKHFEARRQLVISFGIRDLARFRMTVAMQRGAVDAVFRAINTKARSLSMLGLPESLADPVLGSEGLVLVGGAAGSGRSAVIAALVDHRNLARHGRILTIEDPIETVHPHKNSLVIQIELDSDVDSFDLGLRLAQTQDSDLIMASALPDDAAVRRALELVESGRLVITAANGRTAAEVLALLPAQDLRDRVAKNLTATILCKRNGKSFSAELLCPARAN